MGLARVGSRKLVAFFGSLTFATVHLVPALVWRPDRLLDMAWSVGSVLTLVLGAFFAGNGWEWKQRGSQREEQ